MNLLQSTIRPWKLVYINFKLLALDSEQICILHCIQRSHCTATVVYIQTPHSCIYKLKQQQQGAIFIYHATAIFLPTYMPSNATIYANQFMFTWDNYVSIHASFEMSEMDSVNGSTDISHYWHIPLNKYVCHIVQVCPTALLM